jgi:hypothetical protein
MHRPAARVLEFRVSTRHCLQLAKPKHWRQRSCSFLHVIPKLGNLDSYYPMLCGNDRIVNVSQIKHLDGRHQPAVAPQMGRG